MKWFLKVLAPVALLVAGLLVSTAEAAPAGSGLAPLKNAPEASTLAEKTYWVRKCHRTYHGLRCHRVWVKPHHHRHHYRPYKHYRHHSYRHHRRHH
ncbi:MAG: hypothetical protein AB7L90_13780 [Hyphomicrobiaceae bacterium]